MKGHFSTTGFFSLHRLNHSGSMHHCLVVANNRDNSNKVIMVTVSTDGDVIRVGTSVYPWS